MEEASVVTVLGLYDAGLLSRKGSKREVVKAVLSDNTVFNFSPEDVDYWMERFQADLK